MGFFTPNSKYPPGKELKSKNYDKTNFDKIWYNFNRTLDMSSLKLMKHIKYANILPPRAKNTKPKHFHKLGNGRTKR